MDFNGTHWNLEENQNTRTILFLIPFIVNSHFSFKIDIDNMSVTTQIRIHWSNTTKVQKLETTEMFNGKEFAE